MAFFKGLGSLLSPCKPTRTPFFPPMLVSGLADVSFSWAGGVFSRRGGVMNRGGGGVAFLSYYTSRVPF